jgi:hypothetical protein
MCLHSMEIIYQQGSYTECVRSTRALLQHSALYTDRQRMLNRTSLQALSRLLCQKSVVTNYFPMVHQP